MGGGSAWLLVPLVRKVGARPEFSQVSAATYARLSRVHAGSEAPPPGSVARRGGISSEYHQLCTLHFVGESLPHPQRVDVVVASPEEQGRCADIASGSH